MRKPSVSPGAFFFLSEVVDQTSSALPKRFPFPVVLIFGFALVMGLCCS